MVPIQKVAIFGASGNFGTPITAALRAAGFAVTIITRLESTATFPEEFPVIRAAYTVSDLSKVLSEHDAAVCAVGPGGISKQAVMIEAAEAAGVKRFIVSDFGWGPSIQGLPELAAVHAQRVASWEAARVRADANPQFTWTGISTGNPIDWALKKFATMGFDVVQRTTIIYDSGMEKFSGTTLEGIGQSVVGVLQDPDATANRFVKVRSINTCQNELLEAFQRVTRQEWPVQRSTTKALLERGRSKLQAGSGGWVLDMVVAQLFDEGQGRCMVAASREESDADLLGVREESAEEIVTKALK